MLITILWLVAKIIAFICAGIALYFIIHLLLVLIPVNRRFTNVTDGIKIYIAFNGVHTDFIVPAQHPKHNWWTVFNHDNFSYNKDALQYIAFGWGERNFYLELDSWDELTATIAFKAAFLPTAALMHIKTYQEPPNDAEFIKALYISEEQYAELCAYMLSYFEKDEKGTLKIVADGGYDDHDNFYLASGSYHALNTCNYWVNRGLNKIGVRAPIWSPFGQGIVYQLKKIR